MSTTTPWAHLPNAAVIDSLIADITARLKVWKAAEDEAWAEVRENELWWEAWTSAQVVVGSTARQTTWAAAESAISLMGQRVSAATSVRYSEVRVILQDFVISLIAWDASADLLHLTPDALRTIIATCDGDVKHQAVLLLPAVIARSTP